MRNVIRIVIVLGFLCLAVNAELVHRYSFSNNAADSIGSADGQLVNYGSDAYFTGSALELENDELPNSNSTNINYVDLPNGIISALGSGATFEAWVTWHGPSNSSWQRIFDFGTSDAGEDQATGGASSTYCFLSPYSGGGTYRFGHRRGAELGDVVENVIDSTVLPVDQEVHVAVVWDDVAEVVSMYQDGQLVASGPLLFKLTDFPDVNNWLGRSQWQDTAFNGSYNEFRIYNEALSSEMIQASFQSGSESPVTTYVIPNNPSPIDKSKTGDLSPLLTWSSDSSSDIISHRVYLGTDYTTVQTATTSTTGIYLGQTLAGNDSFQVVSELLPGQTYFWRIEEVTSGYVFNGPVWSFEVMNTQAFAPLPGNNANGIAVQSSILQWQPAEDAVGHRILLGTSPGSLQVVEDDYSAIAYSLANLDYQTQYFWRVDELYADSSVVTGNVWSFTTRPSVISCLPGDLNGDCNVTLSDLVIFSQQWLNQAGCIGYSGDCADLVGDNGVMNDDFAVMAGQWENQGAFSVVINEIHYHPDSNIEQVEFIELYNAGIQPVDLNGWSFDGAIDYVFQGVPLLYPDDYIVICMDQGDFFAKYGFSAYGPFAGKLSNEGEDLILRNELGDKVDNVNYSSDFPWPVAANGEGASMELINPQLDNDLAGSWRSSGFNVNERPEFSFSGPTPGSINSIYSTQAPPQVRQVNHSPNQPLSTQSVIITAKITDLDAIANVTLKYQAVIPGSYIPAYLPVEHSSLLTDPHQLQPLNPDFENPANWIEMTMVDDGTGSDQIAGDNIFTAVLDPQINRTLLRYRIVASDTLGNSVQVPYADDESLNFACYVYDSVPDYVTTDASVHPDGAGHAYSSDTLTSLPVYTLITRNDHLYECNGYNGADQIDQGTAAVAIQDAGRAYNWEGCFVYDNKVYDHIGYRLRGGNGRYNNGAAGKRSMKFRFNRGNYFQARDIYGKKFPSKWQHLNTGKMFGNKIVWENYRKYPYGLNEVMNMLLFDIANVPSPHTYWMHFRVIDGPDETPTVSGGQYNGDFWGLYIAFENYDGAFLDRLGLPKGNLYKLSDKVYEGERQLRYQGPDAVSKSEDYENIRWNLNHNASADFIRNHMDCSQWYRYHTIVESIRHFDIFSGAACVHCLKNAAWYFYPDYTPENNYYGKLQFLPFDVDDTWGPFFNYGIDHGKAAVLDQSFDGDHVLQYFTQEPEKSPLRQEYRNYIREFRDLIWQPEVVDTLILDMASVIMDFVPADRDRWRQDPTPGGAIDNGPFEDGIALMEQFAWTPGTFNGNYYWEGTSNHLDNLASDENDDSNIPYTPNVSYIGSAGYPENDLWFQTNAFSDPQGNNTFAAMKWRIAEVEPSAGTSGPYTVNLINSQEIDWKYYRAIDSGPSEPADRWTEPGFNDNSWQIGQTSIGYDDNDDNTDLASQSPPMRGNYTTIYLRNSFEILDLSNISSFNLNVYVDDGCIIWINGTEVARHHCNDETKKWYSVSGEVVGEAAWESVTLPAPYNYFVQGDNTIAIHVLNQDITSSDVSFDMELVANYDGSETSEPLPLAPRKLEVDALWESDELTTYDSDVLMPANGVKPGRTYRVRCKMKDDTGRWSHWSAPVEFIAGDAIPSPLRESLRITELMYNNGDAEFIELYNSGTVSLDLSNVSFTSGITFSFADSSIQSINAGSYVLVIKEEDDFEEQYGTSLNSIIAGTYKGSLSNGGETIKLEDTWDGTLAEFEYNDARGWPLAADGAGHSLVPQQWAIEDEPLGTLNYGGNWRASTYIGGSPGTADPEPVINVLLNEIMAHTDFNDPVNYPDYDSNDWIELFNSSDSTVSLNGNWYLSDDSDELDKWSLPTSTLNAGEFISYDEITGFHTPITAGFGLNKSGEQIFLSYLPGTSMDRVVDCIEFKGQENSVSIGRFTDGDQYWFSFDQPTQGSQNLNPVDHIVISEIMYHPGDGQYEYIELYNASDSAVTLSINLPLAGMRGWAIDGAVQYEIPPYTSFASGNTILVVDFDPANSALLNEFEAAFGINGLNPGVNVFGPWTGSLSNDGERVTFEKPQDSDDPLTPLEVSWVIVDECIYNDYWPWPVGADGTDLSLQRISAEAHASGNDPSNWQAGNPDPGQ